MDVLDYLDERGKVVNDVLDDFLPDKIEPKILADSSKHLIDAGGKRIRPVLALVSCEAVGGNSSDVIEIAAALELLHTFTLVHDDIIDGDKFRRGKKTVHEEWDDSIGILTGDALISKAFEMVFRNSRNVDLERDEVLQLFEIFSETSYTLCQGQTVDVTFEDREKVTEGEYMEMTERKTGSLMSASARVGAILGDGSDEEVEALAEYGRLMGMAFQVRDDVIEVREAKVESEEAKDSDLRRGKWTFLSVKAYENSSPSEREELLKTLHGETNNKDTEKMIELYERLGAVESAEKRSRELIDEAKNKLKVLADSEAKNFLLELADFSINREV